MVENVGHERALGTLSTVVGFGRYLESVGRESLPGRETGGDHDESLEPEQYNLESILTKLEEQNDVFAGKRHGMLMVVSTKDGEILSEQKLQSPPVFNGMIVAGGRLLISDNNGCIVCYGWH